MGLYTIPCKQCNTMFLWFSGLMDQRCPACKLKDNKLRGFLFETCTKCGRRKRFPGPMLHTGACDCDKDNETIGTSQP